MSRGQRPVSFVLALCAHYTYEQSCHFHLHVYATGDALARPCPCAHQLAPVLCARLFLSHNNPQG